MEWRMAGRDSLFNFDILVEEEFAVPQAGSIKLTMRSGNGSIIAGYDRLSLPDTTLSSVAVTIPAAENNITASLFETRYLNLEYVVAGAPYEQNVVYRLTSFLPIQVRPKDVRALVGAEAKELPDSEIDIFESYLLLLESYGDAFSDAISSDTNASIHANRALALRAAIEVLPALPAKLRALEKFNNAEIQRQKINFKTLRADLEAKLAVELDTMFGGAGASTTIFMVSQPTDPITG